MDTAMFTKQSRKLRMAGMFVLCAVCSAASPAKAVYSEFGCGMSVETGTVANAALNVQNNGNLWVSTPSVDNGAGQYGGVNTYTSSFSGITCDDYAKAWLVTAVYGATTAYTATISVSVNGHSIASPTVGTASDGNSNVYGSSVGIWVLSLPIDTSYLYTDGTPNQVSVVVGGKPQKASGTYELDGRSFYQSLVTISQSASLNNTLDYAFAAGGGDIGTSTGYVTSRELNLGSLGSDPISQADIYATYTYGDSKTDALLLNGAAMNDLSDSSGALSSNNVAVGPNYSTANFVYGDAESYLRAAGDNLLKFTVDSSDVTGTPDTSLRPQMVVLGVTHAVPEPGTIVLAATALGTLLAMFFWNRRRT
jgi:hypothetical protein